MNIKKIIIEYFSDFVALIYPQICAACGKSLYKSEGIICTVCRYQLPQTNFHLDADNPISRIFWGRTDIATATAFYYFQKESTVQQLVHALKYRNRIEVGTTVGKWMGAELAESGNFKGIDAIVPVPLHPKRLRSRGYNQSDYIAMGLSKAMRIPIVKDVIVRSSFTNTQTRLNRMNRWENVKELFQLKNSESIAGKHVLLVDDVITTGATIEACAGALLQAPQTKVSVAAMAYAM